MIGTGVFTSLGFQLLDIDVAWVILLLWLLGAILALCGAYCYAELGAALPRSGGEYNFLSHIYHPGIGFVSGWISSTIGFAAPTALAAITAATYLKVIFPGLHVDYAAAILVLLVGVVHMGNRQHGGNFQLYATIIKVALIVLFMLLAWLWVGDFQPVRWQPQLADMGLIGTGGFAVALI